MLSNKPKTYQITYEFNTQYQQIHNKTRILQQKQQRNLKLIIKISIKSNVKKIK